MAVRIYKPAKTAMQSGSARTKEWVLENEPAAPRQIDPLMGWTSSVDTGAQVRLEFATKRGGDRVRRAQWPCLRARRADARKAIRKSYSDNFRFGRLGTWTH